MNVPHDKSVKQESFVAKTVPESSTGDKADGLKEDETPATTQRDRKAVSPIEKDKPKDTKKTNEKEVADLPKLSASLFRRFYLGDLEEVRNIKVET